MAVSMVLIIVLIAGLVYSIIKINNLQNSVNATYSSVQGVGGAVQQTDTDVTNTDSDVGNVCNSIQGCL